MLILSLSAWLTASAISCGPMAGCLQCHTRAPMSARQNDLAGLHVGIETLPSAAFQRGIRGRLFELDGWQ